YLEGKRSGDVYTATELTLLAAVGDKLASELSWFNLRTADGTHGPGQEWSQSLTGKERVEDLVQFAIAQSREALGAESAAVLLVDTENQLLYFPYVAAENTEIAARLRGVRFPDERGIAGAVFHTGEPIRVDDVRGDRRFFGAVDEHTGTATRALLCVPLIS